MPLGLSLAVGQAIAYGQRNNLAQAGTISAQQAAQMQANYSSQIPWPSFQGLTTHAPTFISGPKFDGWREMGLNEIISVGDVAIGIHPFVTSAAPYQSHPSTCTQVVKFHHDQILGKSVISYFNLRSGKTHTTEYWRFYRRTGPRRLPLNKIHSEPVPLP